MADEDILKMKARLEKELGPNFGEKTPQELLRISASNAYHTGKAVKEIRTMVTIIGGMVAAIGAKIFGWL